MSDYATLIRPTALSSHPHRPRHGTFTRDLILAYLNALAA